MLFCVCIPNINLKKFLNEKAVKVSIKHDKLNAHAPYFLLSQLDKPVASISAVH